MKRYAIEEQTVWMVCADSEAEALSAYRLLEPHDCVTFCTQLEEEL